MDSPMKNQLISMATVLILVQVLRRFDLTTPAAFLYTRIGYLVSQLVLFAVIFYLRIRINAANNTRIIEVVEAARLGDSAGPRITKMTVRDYDLSKLREFFNQSLFSLALLLGLHWKFQFIQPLIFQAILPWKTVWSLPLVMLHLRGYKEADKDELKRPFKPPASPFAEMFNMTNETPTTTTDAITEVSADGSSGKNSPPPSNTANVDGTNMQARRRPNRRD